MVREHVARGAPRILPLYWTFVLRLTLAVAVSAVVMLAVAGACGGSQSAEEESGLALPDRVDPVDSASPLGPDAGDDAALDTGVADAPADAPPAALRVFVSSQATKGNLGGFAGADALCKSLATTAGLAGNWAAWLSGNSGGPQAVDRVTSAGPWRLVGGEVVATTKAHLVSGTLLHAIDHDEKGVLVTAGGVWTGTGPNGQYLTNDCDKWTNGTSGRAGSTAAADGAWTSKTVDACSVLYRIYCFQL